MKNVLKTGTAFAVAFSIMGAPLAMAQQDQHKDDHASAQHAPAQHSTMQHAPMQHEAVQHEAVQHSTVQHQYVQHQAIQPEPREGSYSGHHWQHGQHFYGSRRVVSNWQYYHLRQPPEGYEWVQDGSQFVLIAVASGIIADVIANALSQ